MHGNYPIESDNPTLDTMNEQPFRSPLTGLPYYSLADLQPDLPQSHAEKMKMFADARNELLTDENAVFDSLDIAFVALINRQIEILEKAKAMFKTRKFHVRFRGNTEYGAHYINEFEILPDTPGGK